MKDAYTFDRDREGLDVAATTSTSVAYDRIFDRCGLEWYRVESDVGMMGGSAPTSTWRRARPARTTWRSRPATPPTSRSPAPTPSRSRCRRRWTRPRRSTRPGMTTVEAVARALEVAAGALLKAFPVIVDGDADEGRRRARRPPRQRDQARARARRRVPPGAPRRGRRSGSGRPGSSARSATDLPILLDEAVAPGGYVTGANKPDAHLRGVEPGRDFPFEARRRPHGRSPATRSTAPPIRIEPAIEVGNIFKLGTRYSEPLGAKYLDESGKEQLIWMGCYGFGPARVGGRGGRAVRRRARDLLAARRSRRSTSSSSALGQPGSEERELRRPALRRASGAGPADAVRRPRRRAGREVRRRRAARLPAADHRRAAHAGGRRARGSGPPRAWRSAAFRSRAPRRPSTRSGGSFRSERRWVRAREPTGSPSAGCSGSTARARRRDATLSGHPLQPVDDPEHHRLPAAGRDPGVPDRRAVQRRRPRARSRRSCSP